MEDQLKKIVAFNEGETERIIIEIRYNDECGNGHKTLSITGALADKHHGAFVTHSYGCLHDDILRMRPELAKFVKFHLCSEDGPMHYFENTIYHVECANLDHARSTACLPDATLEELGDVLWLQDQLPGVMQEFDTVLAELESMTA